MKRVAVIVDGYSSGKVLPSAFDIRGVDCVHVQSTPTPPKVLQGSSAYDPAQYVDCLSFDGNLPSIVAQLRRFAPFCVVPGTEMGVEFADLLTEQLDVPGNVSALSAARRHKGEMVAAVLKAGLKAIDTITTSSVDEAVRWARDIGYPIVVKPPKSCATNGVTLCLQEHDLLTAFECLLGAVNILGATNDSLIVQRYITGIEYIVDLVSSNGLHRVTDIWRYGKRNNENGASFVYDHAWLLPHRGVVQDILVPYAKDLLDALGIRNGASHCEIIHSPQGPTMVEVGARICGGDVATFCRAALSTDQVTQLVESCVDPQSFANSVETEYSMRKRALRVLLISPHAGHLSALPHLSRIRSLSSYHTESIGISVGDFVPVTTDFHSHPGRIDLLGESEEALQRDMAEIRAMELDGFYIFD